MNGQPPPDRPGGSRKAAGLDRSDDDHMFVDPEQLDFDPDEGLYSGTAVDGTTEIPGPHADQETGELDKPDQGG